MGRRSGGTRRSGGGERRLRVRLKTAKGRKSSSTRWLRRQLNDPYVAEARRSGYRSRAAFKLIELDQRFHLLRPGLRVVDLGAAPGGWTQVAVATVDAPGRGLVVALDPVEMEPVSGATVIAGDVTDEQAPTIIREALAGPADLVLSDMAAPATGHAATDHLRVIALSEAGFELAQEVLAPGGAFVAKVFQGGTERELLTRIKLCFRAVRHAKPPSSRKESAEVYLVATGYRGSSGEGEG